MDEHDLLVIDWRDLKFNPLEPPPGVAPGYWGQVISETFAHANDLLLGSKGYFAAKLSQLYELYDVENTDRYPSLFELKDLIEADRISLQSPKFRYKERTSNRLTTMTAFSGEIFDCRSGYPIGDLLDWNVVFGLNAPDQDVTNFFVEAVITWIYYYRDAMGHRDGLRHVIMFDETKRVFDVNRERQPESGAPPIDNLVGKVREFDEGLVVADHEPSKLTDSIKANTHAKLWMSLGSGKDMREMEDTFGLEPDETDFTKTLETGEALLKLSDRDPVPIILPDYERGEPLTGAELRARMRPVLEEFPVEERVRPSAFKEAIGEDVEKGVSETTEALLASVNEEPFLSMSERYEALGVRTEKGAEAKNELVKLGLVREVDVSTGRPGRNPTFLELTSKGRAVLEDRGYKVAETGRGGIEHRWWQQTIKEYYEQEGYDASIEYAVGRQHVDVYAVRDGETVAIEVARSPEHEVANIRKCLELGTGQIRVACAAECRGEDTGVREEFGEIPASVEFISVTDFA